MYCVYFHDDEEKILINAAVVQINESEVVFKDGQGNIVSFFDRNRVKGTVRVDGEMKVI